MKQFFTKYKNGIIVIVRLVLLVAVISVLAFANTIKGILQSTISNINELSTESIVDILFHDSLFQKAFFLEVISLFIAIIAGILQAKLGKAVKELSSNPSDENNDSPPKNNENGMDTLQNSIDDSFERNVSNLFDEATNLAISGDTYRIENIDKTIDLLIEKKKKIDELKKASGGEDNNA